MRIGLDATPLLGRRTGVGRYTRELVQQLAAGDDGISLTAFTAHGAAVLGDLAPPGVRVHSRRVPARLLRALWQRTEHPVVGRLAGPVDVFHATNFVLPPTGRATGVVTVHDLAYLRERDTVDEASRAYRELVPRSLRRAARVLTPSVTVAEELTAEYGVDPQTVTPIPLGVHARWFRARPDPSVARRLGLPESYVVAVGTLEPRKNLAMLLRAFGAATAQQRDVPQLVLVGPPGWGQALDLDGAAERVHLTGYLDDGDLASVLAGSRGLAFPSRYEGFGLPPLEALACGRPVLVSDLAVFHEVLGEQATYLPLDDVDAWAGALAGLGFDDDPTAVARRRAHAAGFTWAACAERTRQVYHEVCPYSGSTRPRTRRTDGGAAASAGPSRGRR